MAKYDWEAIENAYKKGVDVTTICNKYKVARKTLQNRIYDKKWKVEQGNINEAMSEFGQNLGKLSGIAQNDKILEDIVVERIQTIMEDNELTANNRKLLKLAQSILIKNKEKFDHTNIRNLTGAVKDIESVSNPTPKSVVNNNNTNAQQNNFEVNGYELDTPYE